MWSRATGFFSKWYVVRTFRAIRVVSLAGTIYAAGRAEGLISYASDPHAMDKELMVSVVSSSGAAGYHKRNSPAYIHVKNVAERVVVASQDLCKEEIKKLNYEKDSIQKRLNQIQASLNNVMKKQIPKATVNALEDDPILKEKETLLARQTSIDKEVLEWQNRLKKVKGDWHYIVTDAASVNAFVTELAPRRIFVHQGLLDVCKPTDNELALILGHELSHVLLSHGKQNQEMTALVAMLQLFMLTLVDPTGLWSMLYDFSAYKIGVYLVAGHSRNNEEEADELGIRIAAKACYDTKQGANIFHKLDVISGHQPATWTSTHPQSECRHQHMLQMSETVHPRNMTTCRLEADFKRARKSLFGWWWS